MNVVLYGATGNSGSRIGGDLILRGHFVTAVARDPTKFPIGIIAKQDDLSNIDKIAELSLGADAMITAYGPSANGTDALVSVTERQIAAIKKEGTVRLIVAGGCWLSKVASRHYASKSRTSSRGLCAYRGKDKLMSNKNQYSSISIKDYAIALVDDFKAPAHLRSCFFVG